ncbi:MAG: hypothetical protein KAI86_13880, partial [Desulfobacterales bacterium]|nr:hypothetical protein [Desulfobacterales bacterium]
MPFDSFDLEALDRLAQGGESFDTAQDREPVERLVEPFEIWCLKFGILIEGVMDNGNLSIIQN